MVSSPSDALRFVKLEVIPYPPIAWKHVASVKFAGMAPMHLGILKNVSRYARMMEAFLMVAGLRALQTVASSRLAALMCAREARMIRRIAKMLAVRRSQNRQLHQARHLSFQLLLLARMVALVPSTLSLASRFVLLLENLNPVLVFANLRVPLMDHCPHQIVFWSVTPVSQTCLKDAQKLAATGKFAGMEVLDQTIRQIAIFSVPTFLMMRTTMTVVCAWKFARRTAVRHPRLDVYVLVAF